jgi:hypothetical protein
LQLERYPAQFLRASVVKVLSREPDHAASGAASGAEENNINETAERFGAKRQEQWISV